MQGGYAADIFVGADITRIASVAAEKMMVDIMN